MSVSKGKSRRAAFRTAAVVLLAAVLSSCMPNKGPAGPVPATTESPASEPTIHVTLVQFNDIYEITPVSGGRWGGPARVATVKKRLARENPNTFLVLAGDLFSPSALGTARVNGERLAGRQMVAVLNALGLDYVTFGNHEFDLNEDEFLSRLSESRSKWVSTNVTDAEGNPFPGVEKHEILTVRSAGGEAFNIGLIGLCFDGINPDYVEFLDPIETARKEVDILRDEVDALVAITHLPVGQDIELAQAIPELDLILGGHEHENMRLFRGPDLTPILKADANVRTLYVHDLYFDPDSKALTIDSRLMPVTDEIPDDPATQAVVDQWVEMGFEGFREDGFDPWEVVAEVPSPLNGLEVTIRNQSTSLTDLIARAMMAEVDGSQGSLLNAGSIRVDDVITPGPISQYDVIRILPFGGPVLAVEMKGELLIRVLDQGERNQGGGGFLQRANLSRGDSGSWLVGTEPIDSQATYLLAVADYLVSGNEQGFGFLNPDNAQLRILAEHRDVRLALIEELQRQFGGGTDGG